MCDAERNEVLFVKRKEKANIHECVPACVCMYIHIGMQMDTLLMSIDACVETEKCTPLYIQSLFYLYFCCARHQMLV